MSVLVPLRERTGTFDHMLETLVSTAADPSGVEVIVRCDEDDDGAVSYLRNRAITWRAQVAESAFIVGPRLKGYATLGTFINEAARLARAELLLVVNDDVEFHTKGWDTRLVQVAQQYPDGIFDLAVDTVLNNANCVFPCQSRRQVELLGGFYDERVIYPDIWLRDVLQPFGRVVRVPEVVINHCWKGQSQDQQGAAKVSATADHQALYARCVEEGRAKVRRALEVAA
jgi:hypothetical protein